MPPRWKRAHEFIDLTNDTDDDLPPPRPKQPRTAAPSSRAAAISSSARPMQRSQASSYRNNNAPSSSRSVSFNGSSHRLTSRQQDFSDDELELVGLTQADDGPALQLYGEIDSKVVGVRFYNGFVSPGEVVILRREPNNE